MSAKPCILGKSYGCSGPAALWLSGGCRGVFLHGGELFECGAWSLSKRRRTCSLTPRNAPPTRNTDSMGANLVGSSSGFDSTRGGVNVDRKRETISWLGRPADASCSPPELLVVSVVSGASLASRLVASAEAFGYPLVLLPMCTSSPSKKHEFLVYDKLARLRDYVDSIKCNRTVLAIVDGYDTFLTLPPTEMLSRFKAAI